MAQLFSNVLQIPSTFSELYLTVRHIAFLLVLPVLGVAIIHENIMQLENRNNYTGVFVRLALVMGLLIIYDRFFTMITYGTDLLSKAIMPEQEFSKVLQSIFTEIKNHKDFGVFNLFKGAMINGVTYITYLLTYIAYTVLIWLRFMLLSLLYITGPILISFGIYSKTAGALAGWIRSLFQVSFWIVTLSLLVRIASYMNLMAVYNIQSVNTVSIVTANVLFICLFVFTPMITSILIAEGSIGTVGSTIIGTATATTYSLIRKINLSKVRTNLSNAEALKQKANSLD
jgi:hypothetical protein